MARFDYRKLSAEEQQQLIDELFEVLLAVKSKQGLQRFLLQLITPSEVIMLSRRWQIAKRLAAKKFYYSIAAELGVGISTVQSVDQLLSDAIGNYRERIEEEQVRAHKGRLEELKWRLRGPFPQTLPFALMNLLATGAQRMYWEDRLAQDKKNSRVKKSRVQKKPRVKRKG